MTLHFCYGGGSIVSPDEWLPSEPFDYAWESLGCSRLVCGNCKQAVQSQAEEGKLYRRYWCRCQSQDQYFRHILSEDIGPDRRFETRWACAGHPPLVLPHVLDGIELTETSDYEDIVTRTLVDPPFVAPGFKGTAFWVKRLYRILPTAELKAKVGRAVGAKLWLDDAIAVRAALDFYFSNAEAPGGEQLSQVGIQDRARLLALGDPLNEEHSLYEYLFDALNERLIVHHAGMVDDAAALELAKAALLRGDATDMTIYQVAECDPQWFAQHAVEVATVRRDNLEYAVEALSYLPNDRRVETITALRMISQKAERAVRRWARENGVHLEPRVVKSPSKVTR